MREENTIADKSYIDICNLITSKPENAFMSKDEIKQMYQNSIDVYYDFVKQYNVPLTLNENIMYSVGPLKHLLEVGQYIYLITDYEFTTQSEGTQTQMNGRFTLDRNVL